MEFSEVVRTRRMTRSFATTPVPRDILRDCVDLASRAPSAGKTQGWNLVVLEGDKTQQFWDATLPLERRPTFAWPHLLDAPVIALPFADSDAYAARYGQADKAHSDLAKIDKWPTPYWTIDTSFAVMTFLYATHDAGLAALFFAVFSGADELRQTLGVPQNMQLLGAIATGYAGPDSKKGISATLPRKQPDEIIRWNRW
ncbi:MAG: nitroreductase family protein [Ilumatobacteraceae bacterium]|nr:nitroreductase family protein [Ilumatobacteraceae bacterium]